MAWIDLAVVSVVIKNFPSNRGLTMGLVLTQAGISPLCMLVIDRGFFGKYDGVSSMTASSNPTCEKDRYVGRALLDSDMHRLMNATMAHDVDNLNATSNYNKNIAILFTIGLMIMSIGSIASIFMRFPHKNILTSSTLGSGAKVKVYLAYGINFAVLVLCTIDSILNFVTKQSNSQKSNGSHFLFSLILVLIYAMPFLLILRTKRNMGILNDIRNLKDSESKRNDSGDIDDGDNSNREQRTLSAPGNVPTIKAHYQNFTLVEGISSIEFWLLGLTLFGGTGNYYMVQYQLNQILTACGGTETDLSLWMMVSVIVQCLTRILVGSLQDKLQTKCGLPRPLLAFFFVFVFGGFSQLILAYSHYNRSLLLLGVSFSNICFSGTWSIIAVLSSEILGPRNFNKLFSFLCLGGIGGIIFNSLIAANNYEKEYLRRDKNVGHVCCGYQCYQSTFITVGVITFLLSLAPLILFLKSRKFYHQLRLKALAGRAGLGLVQ